jgi:alpha-beta hydrolase superfamily lysophospholipase
MSGKRQKWAHIAGVVVVTTALSLFTSCKLDNMLFNTKKLTSYTLSNRVIPDSMRTFVSLTSRGNRIYGFYVKSSGAHPDGTILYCHGNLESIEPYWERVELLFRAGYNVFIFDYEGYGMSEGECSEEALYADGRAALAYVRSRPDVNQAHLVIYGWSLGAVVAIDLAAREFTPRVLVCESPFASGEALVQSGTLIDIPGNVVLKGDYNNAAKIRDVHAPFLLFHGTDDRFIDITKNGQVIFDNANEPKKFIRVPGAGHTTVPWTMGADAYIKALVDFIEAY